MCLQILEIKRQYLFLLISSSSFYTLFFGFCDWLLVSRTIVVVFLSPWSLQTIRNKWPFYGIHQEEHLYFTYSKLFRIKSFAGVWDILETWNLQDKCRRLLQQALDIMKCIRGRKGGSWNLLDLLTNPADIWRTWAWIILSLLRGNKGRSWKQTHFMQKKKEKERLGSIKMSIFAWVPLNITTYLLSFISSLSKESSLSL